MDRGILIAALVAVPLAFTPPLRAGAITTPNGHLQLHFLNVGQGDAALVISPQGQVVMIDNGPNNCARTTSYLDTLGVLGVEAHIASHYHADHIGCTPQTVAHAPLTWAAVDRGASYSTQAYAQYAAAVGAKRMTGTPGSTVPLDSGVYLDFLAANGAGVGGASDENDLSLVVRVRYGGFDAVFGGDLSGAFSSGYADVESAVAPLVGPVEVYKVNHHGSRFSSNANWLRVTRPRVGIVSVGATNPYGHPATEALSRLHAAGVRTFWTTAGNGAPPIPGHDTVAGDVVVEVAPGASTFSVRYGGTSETFRFLDVALPPDPPTTLVGNVTGSTVSLSWAAPASGDTPTGYVVEAALTAGGPTIASLPVSGVSATIPGVPNGTYFVRVRAQNTEGVSPPSNEVSITVGSTVCAAPPGVPTTLSGSVAGSVVSFGWGAPTSGCAPSGFTLRAGIASGALGLVAMPVGVATSLQVSAPPGTYYVAVTAENAFGSGPLSNEVRVTVGPSCTMPGPPANFTVSAVNGTANLVWQPPASGGIPTGYVIEAGTATGQSNIASVPTTGTSLSAPVPTGTYYLRVRARNACGVGGPSTEQILTMACAPPAQVAAPSASVSGSSATISWAAVSTATSYRLDVGTVVGTSNITSQVVTGTSRQLAGLANGTYFMRVTALNACGAGPTSGEGMFAVSVAQSPTCGGSSVPANVACGVPTAGCNDGTWSCSQNRSGTCSSHGGVRCWVCPGPLC